jgi:hypothetical protein
MNSKLDKLIVIFLGLAIAFGMGIGPAQAQEGVQAGPVSAGFTYQGQITRSSSPYTGTCDLTFALWDAATDGSQLGTQTISGKSVTGGVFSVQLNDAAQFGTNAFNGDPRWLEVSVKCGGDSSATSLGRQALTAAPYALTAGNALTASNALQLGGKDASAFQPRGMNVVIVSPTGGDFTSIQVALDSITDAGADNPYLVWVGPGVYTEQVHMKPYVDIEGAGIDVTRISYHGSTYADQGTVIGANHAELRSLTVENTGGSGVAVGIFCTSATLHLTHLSIVTSGATGTYGAAIGVYLTSSSDVVMDESTISATGGGYPEGFSINYSSLDLSQVKVTVSGGAYTNTGISIYNSRLVLDGVETIANSVGGAYSYPLDVRTTSLVSVKNSVISALSDTNNHGFGIYSSSNSGSQSIQVQQSQIIVAGNGPTVITAGTTMTIQLGSTLLSGGAMQTYATSSTIKCAGVYDEAYTFSASTCP